VQVCNDDVYILDCFCKDTRAFGLLEREFHFSVPKYSVPLALNNIEANILIVHDEHDEEIPFADAVSLKDSCDHARLVVTQGAGHQRILANRVMIRAVKNFLTETN